MSEITNAGGPVRIPSYLQALATIDESEPAHAFSRAHRVRLLYAAAELRCIADEHPKNSSFMRAIADLIEVAVKS